jgi:hypothetical protein
MNQPYKNSLEYEETNNKCIRTSASEYWLAEHTGNSNCPICKKRIIMSHITREELLALLSVVPEKTVFQIGVPPIEAERTLSIMIYCQLSKENAEQVWEKGQSLNAARESSSPCCTIGPRKETLSAIETIVNNNPKPPQT